MKRIARALVNFPEGVIDQDFPAKGPKSFWIKSRFAAWLPGGEPEISRGLSEAQRSDTPGERRAKGKHPGGVPEALH